MSRVLSRRIARMEAARGGSRVVALFLTGKCPGDANAEKSRMILVGIPRASYLRTKHIPIP
jgi:hypothetical protein